MPVLKNPLHEKIAQELAILDARDAHKNRSANQHEACRLGGHECSAPNARKFCQRHGIWDRVAEIQQRGVRLADAEMAAEISIARVDAEIARVAYFNLWPLLVLDENGVPKLGDDGLPLRDYSRLTPEMTAAVKKIDPEKGLFEFHDKVGLLRDLRRQLTGKDGDNDPSKVIAALFGDINIANIDARKLQMIAQVNDMSETEIARRVAFVLGRGLNAPAATAGAAS